MAYQTIFRRFEMKYLITAEQKKLLVEIMKPYMASDRFGPSTIRNIYYDTDTYRLIRQSMEKPVYKEKLRVRSYAKASKNSEVFVELKKKYMSVVYKRRIVLPENQAIEWLSGHIRCPRQNQISREIDYFCSFYETLHPSVCLCYEREAFCSKSEDDFRITFDENILYRENNLSLKSDIYGIPLLQKGQVMMELKTSGAIPLWMSHFLSEQCIQKTSYSKYGTAYQMMQSYYSGGKLYA